MAPQAVSPYYYSKIRDLKNQNQLTTGKAFLSPEELAAITGAEIAQRYAANERSRDYQLREQAQKTQTDIAYQNLDLNKDIANANKKAAAISGVGQAITGAVGLYGLGKSLGIWGGGTAAAGAGAAGALSGAGPAVGPTVGGGLAATGEAITPTLIGGQTVGGGLSGLGPAIEGGYELGVGGGAALGGLGAGGAALGTEAATALTSAGGAFEAGMGLSSAGAGMAGGGAGTGAGAGFSAGTAAGVLAIPAIGMYLQSLDKKARDESRAYERQSLANNYNAIKQVHPDWTDEEIKRYMTMYGGGGKILDFSGGIPADAKAPTAEEYWQYANNVFPNAESFASQYKDQPGLWGIVARGINAPTNDNDPALINNIFGGGFV